MSYSTIEAAIIACLKADATKYADTNVKAGDSSMIKEHYDRAVRVSNGGYTDKDLTLTIVERTWTIFLDLYVPYRGTMVDLNTRLNTELQSLVDQLAKYPRLNSCAGVTRAVIDLGSPAEPLNPKKTVYRGQRNRLTVVEITKPARVD